MRAVYVKNGAVCVANGAMIVGTDGAEPPCVCGGGPPPPPPPVIHPCCATGGGWLPVPVAGVPNVWLPSEYVYYERIDYNPTNFGPQGPAPFTVVEFAYSLGSPSPSPIAWTPGGFCPSRNVTFSGTSYTRYFDGSETTLQISRTYLFSFDLINARDGQNQPIVLQRLNFIPNDGRAGITLRWAASPGASTVNGRSALPGETLSPLAASASYATGATTVDSLGNITTTSTQISAGTFVPCAVSASALSTGCTNCGDNNTGAALI